MKKSLMGAVLAVAALAGCATEDNSSGATAGAKPAFDLEGWRLIGCCCGSPCPCRLNKKPLHCHGCDHTDVVHFDKGFIGDTDMSGVTWVVVGRGFGEDTSGNWVQIYVADTASEAQFKALEGMLNSDVKSWGDKAKHLAGKFVGMKKAPVTAKVDADGKGWSCAITGVLDFKARVIVNPGRTEPVKSTGIMDAWGDSFTHCEPVAHKYEDKANGYSWDLKGRQANFAPFHVSPTLAQKGGGWGCWTAHSEYGDKTLYEEQMKDDK